MRPPSTRRSRPCEQRRHARRRLATYKKRWARQAYPKRKAVGRCGKCSRPAVCGRTRCVVCLERQRQYAALLRARYRASGICYACGVEAVDKFTRCNSCRAKQVTYAKAWLARHPEQRAKMNAWLRDYRARQKAA